MIFASVPVIQPPDQLQDTWPTWTDCGRELLVIDNTANGLWAPLAAEYGWSYLTLGRNAGVAASWNMARATFLADSERASDLLLLLSSSIHWDDGLNVAMDQMNDAANWKGCQSQHGPHAIAWSRRIFELAGTFDESFWPGYYSDNDWFYRLILGGWLLADPDPMPQVEVNAPIPRDGRAITDAGIISNTAACRELYCAKWGGPPSMERFDSPFNSGLPASWWSAVYRPSMEHINLGETRYR